ncbi:GntR family transcriptional regulator [Streptomyces sp. NPDC127037]|uniref:GntR family transcriptional regulator n=1 Tax=Streptomyces sp. NPDC127037 TaxID=3347113 RepID=UPI003646F3CB
MSLLADTDTYPPRSKLPGYQQLRQQHGVSNSVISSATEVLIAQGRVRVLPQGTYVLGGGVGPDDLPTREHLAQTVRARIADGTIKPGQLIVPGLTREFRVNRHFVNTALRTLAAEGLLVVRRSVGTYVPHPWQSEVSR